MIRVVLDTNVVASALLWNGKPRQLLHAARARQMRLYTSPALLDELADILTRRKFEKKIAASGFSAAQLVDRYAVLAFPVRPVALAGIAPDPDDDVVIGTALAARAEFIVTGDRALLSVNAYRGVRLVEVAQALALIGTARGKA